MGLGFLTRCSQDVGYVPGGKDLIGWSTNWRETQ